MLKSCEIHTDLGCPLSPKSPETPHQMGYLNQLYEEDAAFHESMDLPIGNMHMLL